MPSVVMWSVMARDWTGDQRVIARRLSRVPDRDIVGMRDSDHRDPRANRDATLRALAEWLPRWQAAGRRLATIAPRTPR